MEIDLGRFFGGNVASRWEPCGVQSKHNLNNPVADNSSIPAKGDYEECLRLC